MAISHDGHYTSIDGYITSIFSNERSDLFVVGICGRRLAIEEMLHLKFAHMSFSRFTILRIPYLANQLRRK